jgi:biotin carboxyl carrier protein
MLAPIPGMLVEYRSKTGDAVKAGDTVVVIEAMKMMNNLKAPVDGIVSCVNFKPGDSVSKNDVLLVLDPLVRAD